LDWNDYHKQGLGDVGHIGRMNRNGIEIAIATSTGNEPGESHE
jgi:hypothetical protein